MTNRFLGCAAFVAMTVLGVGSAFAAYQTNSSTNGSSTQSTAASSSNTMNAINGGSNSAMGGGSKIFKSGSLQSGSSVASRQGGGFAEATGASAGTDEQRFGVWGNFAGSGFSESQSAIESSGQIYTFAMGADYRINNWVIAGLSAGYERQNINTTFNQGTWDANGAVVAPYVVVQLIPNQLFLDATVGYVGNSIDLTRNNGGITADTSGTRFFMASNLQANLNYGQINVRPIIGASWLYQGIDGYQESGAGAQNVPDTTIHFGRMIAGGQVGYNIGNMQPYLLAQYQYDYKYDLPTVGPGQVQPTAYKNSALLGGGLLFTLSPRFSGGAQFATEVGKTDYISYTGQGTIRYSF